MFALELFFDPELDGIVRGIWNKLEAGGVSSLATRSHRRHTPHVSLAVGPQLYRTDPSDWGELAPPREVSFDSIATFAGPGGVVFYAARPDRDFFAFHRAVSGRSQGAFEGVDDHYLPGRLTPHCTLAQGLGPQEVGRAVCLAQVHLPLAGRYAGINLVSIETGETQRLVEFSP
ncbi:2'-5' RNA ligase family protein [uncultured Ornithinimicrobium sp.]|uniref:2'-5' RNA ligase family protein n=1 Tax=uncultured Ornithinimicrobium sp. TaxID=259307 RepID=UPI0025943655|nr:2'-5' RNA ligase family protein [uncultured Ornithinimicrobium sp.]